MNVDTCAPAPPDVAVWYDLETTTTDVLAILRLTDADVDAERIKRLVPATAVQIDQYVDRVDAIAGPPPPQPIQYVLVRGCVELYGSKDLPALPGLSAPLLAILAPYKQRFGVA